MKLLYKSETELFISGEYIINGYIETFLTGACSEQNQAASPATARAYLESGYLVRVARLLVYMCPPTSMCTGALDLVS